MRQSKDYWSRRSSFFVPSTRRGGKIFPKIHRGLFVPCGGHPHDAPTYLTGLLAGHRLMQVHDCRHLASYALQSNFENIWPITCRTAVKFQDLILNCCTLMSLRSVGNNPCCATIRITKVYHAFHTRKHSYHLKGAQQINNLATSTIPLKVLEASLKNDSINRD